MLSQAMSGITSDPDDNGIGVAGEFTPPQRKQNMANYGIAQTCAPVSGASITESSMEGRYPLLP